MRTSRTTQCPTERRVGETPPTDGSSSRSQQEQRGSAMEEDEIGVQRAIGHKEYVVCSRCGQPTEARDAALVPGDALEGESEYEYLCSACRQALAEGEQDLPTTLP
jgi:DNA-directed RNA polymerase subunit RPC12/RpoP